LATIGGVALGRRTFKQQPEMAAAQRLLEQDQS